MAHSTLPMSGRTTTTSPAKPVRIASQRCQPTRSASRGMAMAATIRGAVEPITLVVAKGRRLSPARKLLADSHSKVPRSTCTPGAPVPVTRRHPRNGAAASSARVSAAYRIQISCSTG